ncbi:unnamed protein product [Effrenium voratum]|nr:unnamed protein product [Effrenium voratum]
MAGHPSDTASCPNRFWLLWLWPLLREGARRPLREEDIYEIPSCLRSECLDQQWHRKLRKTDASVLWLLLRTFGWRYIFIFFTFSFWLASLSMVPFLTDRLFQWLASGERVLDGLAWSAVLVASYLVNCNAACQWYQQTTRLGCELRASAAMMVFRRTLQLHVQDTSRDAALNLMQVDTERLYIFAQLNHLIYVALVVVTVTLVYLTAYEGFTVAVVAVGVLLSAVLLQTLLSRWAAPRRRHMQQCADERISLMAEILDAVRVLKMYGWTHPLQARVEEIRHRELRSAKGYLCIRAFSSALLYCSPFLSMLAVLATLHLQDKELSAERVFLIFTTIGLSRAPLGGVAMGFSAVVDGVAAFRRLSAFVAEKGQFDIYQRDIGDEKLQAPVSMGLHGSFSHGYQTGITADFDLKPGGLVALCGRVASGKSSLLLAMLGEMRRIGAVSVPGGDQSGVAYLPQSPWIRSGSVREAVVQDLPFEKKQYWRALRAAQLLPDLAIWGNDSHPVGARGATLSGGQRTRLGLAHLLYRCLVSDVKLVLIDDCLAAVDVHVARAICEEAVLGTLLDGQRTVVMVMNSNFVAIQAAQSIINMVDGEAKVYQTREEWLEDCSDATRQTCMQTMSSIQARTPSCEEEHFAQEGASVLETAESSVLGSLHYKTFVYYFGSGRYFPGLALLVLVLSSMLLVEFLRIYADHFMGTWAARDATNTEAESSADFRTYCIWIGAAVVGVFARALLVVRITIKSSRELHSRVLVRLMKAPLSFFDETPRGRILGHFSKDLDATDALLPQYLLDFLQDITTLLGIVLVCVWSTPLAALAVFPVLFAFYKIRTFFSRTARETKRLEGLTRAPLYSAVCDAADGLATLRAHGQEGFLVKRFQALLDRNGKVFFQTNVLQPWCILVLDSLGSAIVCITSVFCVLLRQSLEASTMTMAISYALMTRGKLQFCIRLSIETENQFVAAERLQNFEASVPTETSREDEEWSVPSEWPQSGAIHFKEVTMHYQPQLPVLQCLTLHVAAGQKLGLVGRTGSGKSSLLAALLRTTELSLGQVLVDGVDIRRVPLARLRAAVSLVPQEPVLWSGTVAENLDPAQRALPKDLEDALCKVHLDKKLDMGSDTRVEMRGNNFSLGERQLLCIARCIARHSRIVLVDEATSCVDGETDALIQFTFNLEDALHRQFKGVTMLVVAHRLQTIMDADLIAVLDAGKVVETGAESQLPLPGLVLPLALAFLHAAGFSFLEQQHNKCQDLGMQMLWAAEIQARQFGVRGSTDPFDHAQLPLLATQAPGSRAAKRQRQRERRKLGKALARGEAVDDLAAAAGVTMPAVKKGSKPLQEVQEAEVEPIVSTAPEVEAAAIEVGA